MNHVQLHCRTEETNRVELRIRSLNLESSYYGCPYDKLTVYDGMYGTMNWNKTGDYCRRTQTYTLHSSGPVMKIVFTTDSSRSRSGFSLELRSVCGGYVTSSRGTLTSPNYPQPYNNNEQCQWIVGYKYSLLIGQQDNNTRFWLVNMIQILSSDW